MSGDQRLAAAVKPEDGFFATFLVSPYSRHIVRWAARRGITPNRVTAVSMVLGVCAAAAFATGRRAGLVAGAVLVQISFVADCVDGQLARFTGATSALGAWLDTVSDRVKEVLLYTGLAVGATAMGQGSQIWLLACCALALLAVRQQANLAFAAQHVAPDARPVPPPVGGVAGAGMIRTADALERSWWRWAKRIIVLPIGERFALISVTAAFAGPRTTFLALLGWGGVATLYTVSGRVLRSLA